MFPNQPILLTVSRDGDSEDTFRYTLIHQIINQLPIPGNQRLMRSPFPTRHSTPSLTTSRALQRFLQRSSHIQTDPNTHILLRARSQGSRIIPNKSSTKVP